MSDKATDLPDSTVIDSGLVEADVSVSTTNANPSESTSRQEASSVNFSKISEGVFYLSDSSSQTEKASTEVEDSRWPSSVSSSSTQQPQDGNSTATVHSDPISGSSANNLRFLSSNVNQPSSWKNEVPKLDTFESVQASPPQSASVSGSQSVNQASFSVGTPDAYPYEEENVEGSSAMILHNMPEQPLTGDPKEDRARIISLEAKLRDNEAKIDMLNKQLAKTVKEREHYKRQLELANVKIKEIEDEGVRASALQKEQEEKIAELKKRIAESEKNRSDEKDKYCKEIDKLREQLKEEQSQHHKKVLGLVEDKHALELKVEKMNTNEERLKRELNEAKLESVQLKLTLGTQEMSDLRTKSSEALTKKDGEIKQKDDQIRELQRLLSEASMRSYSSQSSGAENKDDQST